MALVLHYRIFRLRTTLHCSALRYVRYVALRYLLLEIRLYLEYILSIVQFKNVYYLLGEVVDFYYQNDSTFKKDWHQTFSFCTRIVLMLVIFLLQILQSFYFTFYTQIILGL